MTSEQTEFQPHVDKPVKIVEKEKVPAPTPQPAPQRPKSAPSRGNERFYWRSMFLL
jgi:hypothetical protein